MWFHVPMTRWTNRTPRLAGVTRRAARPVCTAGHTEALTDVAAAVAELGAKIEAYDTHLGHVHATMIGEELESRMERRELATRVANVATAHNNVVDAFRGMNESLNDFHERREAKLANLVDVVADLAVKLNSLACRESEVEGA